MNDLVETLMYESGLTASGCWDSMDDYDRSAIELLVKLVAKECMTICVSNALDDLDTVGRTSSAKRAFDIKNAFDIE